MKIIPVVVLIFMCLTLKSYSQDTTKTNQNNLKRVSTIGIFDGEIVSVGNFEPEKVYKINEYCISLTDLSDSQIVAFKGQKVLVTGELKIVEGAYLPSKTSSDEKIYEPYKEPDKKFISRPTIIIVL